MNYLFLLLGLCYIPDLPKTGAAGEIVAEVINFRNNNGVCRVCLFNTSASFNGEGSPVQCVTATVVNKRSKVTFTNVSPGTYAVSVFHDANNNNRFDKNFLGIPKEGYGASKNNLPFAAAPGFNENKFDVKSGNTIQLSIRLRYL